MPRYRIEGRHLVRYDYTAEEIADLREYLEYWREEQLAKIKRAVHLACPELTSQVVEEIVSVAPKSARCIARYLCEHLPEQARWVIADDAGRRRLILRALLLSRSG